MGPRCRRSTVAKDAEQRKRCGLLSIAALSVTATAHVSRAALTTITFTGGTTFSLVNSADYTPTATPASTDLADVTTVAATGGATSLSVIGADTTLGTSVTLGALAFDVSAGSGIYLDSTSSTSNVNVTTLTLSGGNAGTGSNPVTQSGDLITLTSNVNGLVDLRGFDGGTSNSSGGIKLAIPSGGGNFDIASNSTLELGSQTTMSGSGGITVTGGGTLSIFGSQSTFTGGFTVSGGSTLDVLGTSTLSVGSTDTTTLNNGKLILQGTTLLGSSHPIALAGSGGTISSAGTGSVELEDLISGSGTTLNIAGTGTVYVGSFSNGITNTFSGAVAVNSGTLQISSHFDLNAVTALNLNGGTFAYAGFNGATGTTLPLALTVTLSASANNIDVGTNSNGTITTLQIGGTVTGSGGLVKTDVGTLILSVADTYTNGTTIDDGILQASAFNQLGSSSSSLPDALTLNGGTLYYTGTSVTSVSTRPLYVGASGGTISVENTGTIVTINGVAAPAGALTTSGALNVVGPGEVQFSNTSISGIPLIVGPSSGSGAATVAFSGVGPAVSSLASSGFGSPSIVLGNSTAPSSTTLTIGSDNTNTIFAGVIGDLSGTNSAATGSIIKTGSGTLVLSGTNTYTGTTTINGGTLSLSTSTSNNIASSSKIVVNSGGTLNVNGVTASGGFALASGQVLAGSGGTVAGSTTVASGSTITAGSGATSSDSVGTLNTGTQTWNGGGTFAVKIDTSYAGASTPVAGTAFDQLVMSGLTIGASSGNTFTIAITSLVGSGSTPFSGHSNYVFPIATVSDSISSFNTPDFVLSTSGFTANGYASSSNNTSASGFFSLVDTGSAIDLDYTAAPELTSTLLFGIVAAPLLLARRRRRLDNIAERA